MTRRWRIRRSVEPTSPRTTPSRDQTCAAYRRWLATCARVQDLRPTVSVASIGVVYLFPCTRHNLASSCHEPCTGQRLFVSLAMPKSRQLVSLDPSPLRPRRHHHADHLIKTSPTLPRFEASLLMLRLACTAWIS